MDQSIHGSSSTVAVSEELFAPVGDDIELCYQTFGDPDDEPLLLVMGVGGPMNWWDAELCEELAERGFYVVRYDNRDTGRSSRGKGRVTRATLVNAFAGRRVKVPYSLSAMADDAFGLMDHLGLESAHVTGVSMGGMIAQTMAIKQPARVRSLTSIMSTTGRRTVGWQHPSLFPNLLAKRGGREAYLDSTVVVVEPDRLARLPADRGADPGPRRRDLGPRHQRQRACCATCWRSSRSRTAGPRLHALRVPTLVVHGLADKMVHVSGGRATAAAIPGAELLLIDGMGHDLPPDLFDTFASAIRRTADRAR